MSKRNECEPTEESIEQGKILNAVTKAVGANRGIYKMTLLDGTEIEFPVHQCPHVIALQAQRGEKFIDTSEDLIDDERNVRLWIKKVNAGLEDGWCFVNDRMKAPNPPVGDIANKRIPISQVTTEHWALLESCLYPGSELDRKSIRERANSIFGKK